MSEPHFSPALFDFLEDLAAHNDRDWFNANKARYEEDVLEPSLAFISDFGPRLRTISRHFDAIPKRVGGSMFRIYRDVRFAKDKSPYKTHVGIHFRHQRYKDAYAPGFYLHLQPGESFVGAGLWHPDAATLRAIRDHLVAHPRAWRNARDQKPGFELAGDALKRPPKGYDPDHPLIDDLKRKDFIVVASLDDGDVVRAGFIDRFAERCSAAAPLVRFLCRAVDVPF